jgi:hypothetical protein
MGQNPWNIKRFEQRSLSRGWITKCCIFLISLTVFIRFHEFIVLTVPDKTVKFNRRRYCLWSRGSSVGIVTPYGFDGQGLNPGRDKIYLFSTASRPAVGPTQPPIQWVLGEISSGVKRQEREADHSPPSRAEANNGVAISPPPYVFMAH